ncbi:MAG: acyl-CoA/acyl-ACP dehydrogenase [Betaproteobacteria bacterium]|nr:acyl-CoA/acyl-ACP dehydrogenase [Betaproteobacteria bacterium]
MNFDPTDEQKLAVDAFRRFLERDIAPVVERHRDAVFPKPVAHELLAALADYGVGNGWVPDAGGGLGIGYISSGLLYEELARVSADLAGLAYVHEGAAMKIFRGGSEAIKARYLPGLLSGQAIGCSAVTEPGGGSGVRGMRTRAVAEGDGFRISGEKTFISNAPIADVIMLTALTGPQEFTMFLIDPREHRIETREISKLGLTSWSLGSVVFSDTLVSRDYVIGGVGAGLRETMRGFERARLFISILALGIGQAALEASIRYAKDRLQFDRPIGGHQLVQELVADMATELHAARLLTYRGLDLVERGVRCNLEAAMAKAFATEAVTRIASRAVQVHGAYGLTREFPLERHFRDARMLTVPDGTTQINQLVIGRELLGLDAFGAGPK